MSDWEEDEVVPAQPQYNSRQSDNRNGGYRNHDDNRRDNNYRSRNNDDRSDRRGGGGYDQSRSYSNRNQDSGGGGGGGRYGGGPSMDVEIEPNKVGMVIGRAGSKIKEIQSKFNVHVNISKNLGI